MQSVEAVQNPEQIGEIETLLKHHHGQIYADIWRIGLNLSLRISDLLAIRYSDIDLDNRSYTLKEGKTGKTRHIRLNDAALAVIQRRRKEWPDDIFLFQVHSNRAKGKPIRRETVSRAFKDVGERLGIRLGTHSMRKTRGYIMHSRGVSLEMVAKVLNHSSPSVTMRYIGLEKEQVLQTYDDFVI